MIENIRRIGLFMIVAQTFIHFAAGKQYEKYMKIIAGVIVLLLFVRPFSSSSVDFAQQWQREMDRLTEQMEKQNSMWEQTVPDLDHGTERKITRQFEEEIKERLNREIPLENCLVTDVMIEWEDGSGEETGELWEKEFGNIVITLQQTTQEQAVEKGKEVDPVFIERIQVETGGRAKEQRGDEEWQDDRLREGSRETEQGTEQDKETGKYCRMFAEALGIEETQVEVIYGGGR